MEIERALSRSLDVYRTKIDTYGQNPSVIATWYVSEFAVTARRVQQAAQADFAAATEDAAAVAGR